MELVKDTNKEQNFKLILNKDYIPSQYISEEDKELFKEEKTILRETSIDITNLVKVKQCFDEFNKYLTVGYAKFLNQEYLSACTTLDNLICIKIIAPDKLITDIFNKFIQEPILVKYFVIRINSGYIIVFKHNIREKKEITVQRFIEKIKNFNKKQKKDFVSYENNILIPIPGTLDGNKLVNIIEEVNFK